MGIGDKDTGEQMTEQNNNLITETMILTFEYYRAMTFLLSKMIKINIETLPTSTNSECYVNEKNNYANRVGIQFSQKRNSTSQE